MTRAFSNAVFHCSSTPSSELKTHYSSFERDPLLLAGKLSRSARSGSASQLAKAGLMLEKAHISLAQSAYLPRNECQLAIAAASLIKAFYISQGFIELSSLYRVIMHDLLQPLIGKHLSNNPCLVYTPYASTPVPDENMRPTSAPGLQMKSLIIHLAREVYLLPASIQRQTNRRQG